MHAGSFPFRSSAALLIGLAALLQACATTRTTTSNSAAAASAVSAPSGTSGTDLDARIAFYEGRLKENPRLYPIYAQLAGQYLQKGQVTHDVTWIARARETAQKGLAMQPTYEGMVVMAQIQNHTHRFAEGLEWARKAVSASPVDNSDPLLVSLQVTSLMGLGRDDEAKALLPTIETDKFHGAAALAQYLSAQGQKDEAAKAFQRAAALARKENVPELAAWAEVMTAGTLIDTDRAPLAKPYLARARELNPDDKELRIHEAEVLQAEGDLKGTLAVYEAIVSEAPDAAIAHRAFLLARELGDEERATRYFRLAESALKRTLEAGEIMALGELANLYADAGVNAEEARELATRNLEFKRDREAMETIERTGAKALLP